MQTWIIKEKNYFVHDFEYYKTALPRCSKTFFLLLLHYIFIIILLLSALYGNIISKYHEDFHYLNYLNSIRNEGKSNPPGNVCKKKKKYCDVVIPNDEN